MMSYTALICAHKRTSDETVCKHVRAEKNIYISLCYFFQKIGKSFARQPKTRTLYTTDDLQANREGVEGYSEILSDSRT